MKFAWSDDGKIVHTLEEPIKQVRDLYVCTNFTRHLHRYCFNVSPRYDYGGRHFGTDLIRLVADKFLTLKGKLNKSSTVS